MNVDLLRAPWRRGLVALAEAPSRPFREKVADRVHLL
jgi:hypothetical protein